MSFSRIHARLPTKKNDIKTTVRVARLVLVMPRYTLVWLISSFIGLSIFVLSQNIELVQTILLSDYLTINQRVTVFSQLYPIVGTAFTPAKEVFLLTCSLLFGVNLAMAIYHIREHQSGVQSGAGSAIGMIFGTLGAGCAACGSVVLTGFLSLIGATSALALLPFDGLSFSALALLVFLLSIYWTADGMRGGMVNGCPIDL